MHRFFPISSLRIALIAVLLMLCGSISLRAQQASDTPPVIQNVMARSTITLDGTWGVVIDPFETGYYNYRYKPNPNGYFRDQKPQHPSDLIEYNFDTGPTLTVPGDWNTQQERLFLYEGTVWYKRRFTYQKTPGQRLYAYFGAANYEARVYLNGEYAGTHVGGFTPFNVELTDLVREGDNVLIVKVDNQRRMDAVPTVNTDWWNYGGLTRSVSLVELPETFIEDYFLQLRNGAQDEVEGWVRLNGPATGQMVTVEIPEADIRQEVQAGEDGVARFRFQAALTLWSPAQPKLYDVTVRTPTDEVRDRVGFRTIEQRGEDILLNGEPIFLRGVSIHEEKPYGGGRAATREDAEVLLGWAREMNCNFVRLAHYPHNEHMVRLADEMGLLVWSEIPVYWTVQFDDAATYANAEGQLREMIARDKNRAAVILWSVANETPVTEGRMTFLTRLATTARQLDPTRLITAALDTQTSAEDGRTRLIEDPLGEVVDVIGVNSYCGWYVERPERCSQWRWRSAYDKPMIMSEFGGGALQGLHGAPDERWTEEYQAAVYEHNLEMLRHISFLRGTAPWILKDFRSPRRPLPRIQDFWNRKGLLSNEGVKKQAFYIMQNFYAQLPTQ